MDTREPLDPVEERSRYGRVFAMFRLLERFRSPDPTQRERTTCFGRSPTVKSKFKQRRTQSR